MTDDNGNIYGRGYWYYVWLRTLVTLWQRTLVTLWQRTMVTYMAEDTGNRYVQRTMVIGVA